MSALARPEWLKPGAEVVLWSNGVNPAAGVVVTKVATIADKSFTVEAKHEPRFPIDTMRKRVRTGGYAGSEMRHVMPTSDPVGRYWVAVLHERKARQAASAATTKWEAEPTVPNADTARRELAGWLVHAVVLDGLKQEAGKR